jgi:hypothetical protein
MGTPSSPSHRPPLPLLLLGCRRVYGRERRPLQFAAGRTNMPARVHIECGDVRPEAAAKRLQLAGQAYYPPNWPAEMKIEVAAAYLGFATTNELRRAIQRGEAPRPSATRGAHREPVWAKVACDAFVERRHLIDQISKPSDTLEDLV